MVVQHTNIGVCFAVAFPSFCALPRPFILHISTSHMGPCKSMGTCKPTCGNNCTPRTLHPQAPFTSILALTQWLKLGLQCMVVHESSTQSFQPPQWVALLLGTFCDARHFASQKASAHAARLHYMPSPQQPCMICMVISGCLFLEVVIFCKASQTFETSAPVNPTGHVQHGSTADSGHLAMACSSVRACASTTLKKHTASLCSSLEGCTLIHKGVNQV